MTGSLDTTSSVRVQDCLVFDNLCGVFLHDCMVFFSVNLGVCIIQHKVYFQFFTLQWVQSATDYAQWLERIQKRSW